MATAALTAHPLGLDGLDSLPPLEALLLFVAEDDRPLPSAAGYVDWRLAGGLSRILLKDIFTGSLGDSLLMPSGGGLAPERIFVLGLGRRAGLTEARLGEALAQAGKVLSKAKVTTVALEVPVAGSVDDAARVRALREHFLPAFGGQAVRVLSDKALAKLL
jgi:hypothetical protein